MADVKRNPDGPPRIHETIDLGLLVNGLKPLEIGSIKVSFKHFIVVVILWYKEEIFVAVLGGTFPQTLIFSISSLGNIPLI